ncbi:MAG: Coenzyme F420 hydrogenase/dehydrogenase, beta subunit C-terminal domain [Lachnospiraceae bacterium]|nr:Coenzyme F420 hydrogenase/dehydrogenase, beta subunit C-terminal domain [Lachnospiraceae bacterium]
MININEKKTNCCGCTACAQVCPKNCITMEADAEGFSYPVVDTDKCISCNRCDSVCPIINKVEAASGDDYPKAIGGWHKDEDIRALSSSGGAFSLFAQEILEQGGVVYGCALDDKAAARHICVDSLDDLDKLRGSKYVQSALDDVYESIRKLLEEGRKVLFTGAPCQAAGLCSYLGDKRSDNLYLIDFICHGVPSPRVFAEYIAETEKEAGSRVTGFKFRLKDHGWSGSGMQLGTCAEFENGDSIRNYPAFRDPFMNGFLDDTYLRPSCYDCSFKDVKKGYSDFTIADFWGVDKVSDKLNDGKGTSLIIIHNEHARELWNNVKDNFFYQEVSTDAAIKRNRSIKQSPARSRRRDRFFTDLDSKGYKYVKRKYMSGLTWAWHRLWKMFGRFEQFIKFSFVGVSNTVISLAVYYICIFLGLHYMLAYTLGFLLSVCNAFFWNNRYVFTNKQEKSIVRAFLKVLTSYGFSFLLSLVLMGLLVDILKIPQVIAPLLKMTVTIPINFVLNKVWAFKDKK